MLRKILLCLVLMSVFMPVYAEQPDNGGHAGTPPGFYEDIDPATLEEEENDIPGAAESDEGGYQEYSETEDVVMPPQKTKSTKDYAQIYNSLEVPTFSYLHNIDPEQYYDLKDATWSVYPLLRLNSPIYFKSVTVEPGYYLLTPREHEGKWFMLFKQNGLVKYIIPVYERDYTPEMFYDEHIPKPKYTFAQKIHMGFLDFIGNLKSTKRKTPVQTYLEVNDLENYFVSIVIYYGAHKYYTIFRTIRL